MTITTFNCFRKYVFYFILSWEFKLFSQDNLTTCIYVTRYWSRYQNSSFMLFLNRICCVLTFHNIQCISIFDAMSIVVLHHRASIPMLNKSHVPISIADKEKDIKIKNRLFWYAYTFDYMYIDCTLLNIILLTCLTWFFLVQFPTPLPPSPKKRKRKKLRRRCTWGDVFFYSNFAKHVYDIMYVSI